MKNEFALAFNEVIEEKQLPREVILMALESAMVSAYRRSANASAGQTIEAKVDPETGKVFIYAEKEVVEAVENEGTEASLEEARSYDPNAEIGSMVMIESTPEDFGRVAAQTARQVIQQRIRDAERQAQLAHYDQQVGEIVSGVVQAVNSQGLTIGLDLRAEGMLSRKDLIPGERFRIHDRVRALIAEVKDTNRGPQIVLSRTHRDFLRRLLENEVPEIYHGVVEVRSIAREPGERAKVAVSATQSGIDPVGACVGIRGVRIQAIVRELHDEKIDVIEWSEDPTVFIAKAISPARVSGVYLNEKSGHGKTATVVVTEDQLSLAIGRDGQNARLAAKLTGWRIDIKSLTEAVADTVHKLQTDPEMVEIQTVEVEKIPDIEDMLTKKSEGRPLTPEEYDQMSQFVNRVEKRVIAQVEEEVKAQELEEMQEFREKVSEQLFQENILDSQLPEHVNYFLQEAGYMTTGDLVLRMLYRPDDIFRIQGIGPKAMKEIDKLLALHTGETDQSAANIEEGLAEVDTTASSDESVEIPQEAVTETETTEAIPEMGVLEEVVDLIPEPDGVTPEIPDEAPDSEVVIESITASDEVQSSETDTKQVTEGDEEEEDEEETSFDELFALKADEIGDFVFDQEETQEDGDIPSSTKKRKKKKKHVEVEYDPERDMTVYRKKRKRGSDDLDWDPWES